MLIERFTLADANTLDYRMTVNDPKVYAASWTLRLPIPREESYGYFEYGCHEGNYAMPNLLAGSRAEEKRRAEAVARGEKIPEYVEPARGGGAGRGGAAAAAAATTKRVIAWRRVFGPPSGDSPLVSRFELLFPAARHLRASPIPLRSGETHRRRSRRWRASRGRPGARPEAPGDECRCARHACRIACVSDRHRPERDAR